MMFKISVLALSLFSTFALAKNVTIDNESMSGSIPVGTSMNQVSSEAFSLDVPSGFKVVTFSNENFEGEKVQYKRGSHSNVFMQSFTVENDLNTAYSMTFKDFKRNSTTCLDVKYRNRNYEDVTATTICHDETKEVFPSAPEGFRAGDYLSYSVWEDNQSLVTGQLFIQPNGVVSGTRRPSTVRKVKAVTLSTNHLQIGFIRY